MGSKPWTLLGKKEQGGRKEQINEGMKIAKPSWRVADRPGDRLLFQCDEPMKEKVKLAMQWSSRRVIEHFREVVPYRPTPQNVKRLKAKAGRR
ncbi:hypothetical protein H5410_030786 [Solanum commersonii]|uniref:Uncharacterized protein n=1 Tax=Solanum commersonii TaxID=4109 RepID=A0A9J5YIE8_SOLCO|nr:hypothetical protein H5410_030786 [Solanum commersonii]